jgi:hypothetical protein
MEEGALMNTVYIILYVLAATLILFNLALLLFPKSRFLNHLTRPLRAYMMSRGGKRSYQYAYEALSIMDKVDQNAMNALEFLRAGARLSELYPDDHDREQQRLRNRKTGSPA